MIFIENWSGYEAMKEAVAVAREAIRKTVMDSLREAEAAHPLPAKAAAKLEAFRARVRSDGLESPAVKKMANDALEDLRLQEESSEVRRT